ncbi:MAG: hypothetical protein J4F99_06770 [Acidimicrobiia bacterium]|nr:hypothetical protein [Acidimicrobiia bacterium]
MSLRRFFRLLRHNPHPSPRVDDSLAKTVKDASHVGASTRHYVLRTNAERLITKGHKDYVKSFKKKH